MSNDGAPDPTITVFLLDDHEVVRLGVRELLEGERRSVVVRVANYKAGLVRAAAFVTSESAGRQWSGICPVVQNRRQVPSAQPA